MIGTEWAVLAGGPCDGGERNVSTDVRWVFSVNRSAGIAHVYDIETHDDGEPVTDKEGRRVFVHCRPIKFPARV